MQSYLLIHLFYFLSFCLCVQILFFLMLRVVLLFHQGVICTYQIIIVRLWLFLNMKLSRMFCFPVPLKLFLHIITNIHVITGVHMILNTQGSI